MSKPIRLVGTFTPVPGAAGFVLPIFRAETSNMHMVQVIDHKGVVSALVHEDVSPMDSLYNQDVWTEVGSPAVYAVRRPNDGLEAGTREHLAQVLSQPIEDGEFDAMPVTRFRLSAFLRLGTRQAADAQSAWTWVGATSTPWAADNWKVEGTIVPEFRRRIEFCLEEAGESEGIVRWVCRGIEVNVDDGGRLALSVAVPGDGAEATRCREILAKASDTLTGDAPAWWPELRGNLPKVVIPSHPISPEPDRLPVWIIFAAEDKPWVEWIESTLAGAGYRVSPFPEKLDEIMQRWREPTHILPLLSEQSAPSEWLRNQVSAIEGSKVRPIRVQEVVPPLVLRDRLTADLWGILEEQAELRLLDAVGGPATGWTFNPPTNRPPFPGTQTIHNLPPRPSFVGRYKELGKLRDWMVSGHKIEGAKALISGLPGIGKTALAIEAAYRNLEKFRVVWWIRGEHVNEDLGALAERLDFYAPDEVVLVDFAVTWLSEHHDCLIIIDDIPQRYNLAFLDDSASIALFTSRRSSIAEIASITSIGGLSDVESTVILHNHGAKSAKVIRRLVRDLGGHPQALMIASKFVTQNADTRIHFFHRRPFEGFLKLWSKYITELDGVRGNIYQPLKKLSFFGDSTVPPCLWKQVLGESNEQAWLWHMLDTCIVSYSRPGHIRINQPISRVVQSLMNRYEQEKILLELVDICSKEFVEAEFNALRTDMQKKSIPCLISLLYVAADCLPIEDKIADLWCWVVDSLLFCGRYSKAREIAYLAMKKSNPTLFNRGSFSKLQLAHGRTIFALGDYEEAYRALGGAAHLARDAELPGVAADAAVWAGIALLRNDQDDDGYCASQHPLARQLLEQFVGHCRLASTRALADQVLQVMNAKMHGVQIKPYVPDTPTNEPDTVRVWRMVGEQYLKGGQPDAAGALFRLAEDATAQIWGRGHPEMAETLACLSEAQMAMGDREEGMRNAAAALGIASRKLGRKHPLTVRLMNVLGDEGQSIPMAKYLDDDDEELAIEI